jgi:hypothetical protein
MDATFLVSIFCLTLFLGLVSLGFQIYVSRQLKKAGAKVGIPVGKRSWIAPFVLGWQYAKPLEIMDVMAFWSFIIGLTFIAGVVMVFGVVSMAP